MAVSNLFIQNRLKSKNQLLPYWGILLRIVAYFTLNEIRSINWLS
jgi:hypothetical protein